MHLGIIGYGNIGATLVGLLDAGPVARVTVLVRPGAENLAHQSATKASNLMVQVVSSFDDFLAAAPDLVVECAGHSAVASYGSTLLEGGTDLIVASVGALADERLHASLTSAAAGTSAGRMILPIGAIGGLDLLSTLAPAGDLRVAYVGTKPPAAWKGSAAEKIIDLDAVNSPIRFFSGNAREAARAYPKNANVVAALALVGTGFENTRVDLVADPDAKGNTHAYHVESPLCRYDMKIAAIASPDNSRTSATTAWSLLLEVNRAEMN